MRKFLGTIAGIAVAILVILAVEAAGAKLFPMADEIETGDAAAIAAMVAAMPFGAKLLVVCGWLAGAFAGGYVAFRLARWEAAGWIVAMLVAAGGIANIVQIPHPLWMQLCAVALPFVGALFAFGLYRRGLFQSPAGRGVGG